MKLEAYARLYADVLQGKRMCTCGVLAAEYETLPKPMRNEVIRLFDENQRWLADLLRQGHAQGTLSFTGSAEDVAQSILSTLEGAMLVGRPYGDLKRFNATTDQLVASLAVASPPSELRGRWTAVDARSYVCRDKEHCDSEGECADQANGDAGAGFLDEGEPRADEQ